MLPLIAGAAIEAGGNLISGLFSESNARSAYQHRYQDEVRDLRAAGLNPALAYGQNPGNPTTQPLPDIGSAAASGYATAQAAKQAAAMATQAKANADNTQAQTGLLKAQTGDLTQQVRLRNRQIAAETRSSSATAARTAIESKRSGVALQRERTTLPTDITGAVAASQLRNLELPQARAIAQWFREHPNLGGWLNSAAGVSHMGNTLKMLTQLPVE